MPRALDAAKPGGTQRRQMPGHTVDKPVAVQEMTARSEQTMDRGIALEDLFPASQIVEYDRGDRQIEWPADMPWPCRIHQVCQDVRNPIGVAVKPPARLIEHCLGII